MTDQTERENFIKAMLEIDMPTAKLAAFAWDNNWDHAKIWQARAALDGGAVLAITDRIINQLAEWWSGERGSVTARGDIQMLLEKYHRLAKINMPTDDTQRDGEAVAQIRDAAENVVISYGMGWDIDGVIEVLRAALRAPSQPSSERDLLTEFAKWSFSEATFRQTRWEDLLAAFLASRQEKKE